LSRRRGQTRWLDANDADKDQRFRRQGHRGLPELVRTARNIGGQGEPTAWSIARQILDVQPPGCGKSRKASFLAQFLMETYGGPAQPSPTIGQCLNGGYGWLEVECHRCNTRASIPLESIWRTRDAPIWKLEAALKCPSCRKARYAPPARTHDQAAAGAGDHTLSVGAPG